MATAGSTSPGSGSAAHRTRKEGRRRRPRWKGTCGWLPGSDACPEEDPGVYAIPLMTPAKQCPTSLWEKSCCEMLFDTLAHTTRSKKSRKCGKYGRWRSRAKTFIGESNQECCRKVPVTGCVAMGLTRSRATARQGAWPQCQLWKKTFGMPDTGTRSSMNTKPTCQTDGDTVGYRELYPEEFDTDSDGEQNEQNSVNGKRKRHLGQQSSLELPPRKKPKKSHKKKQKKKSHKKQKKKRRREEPSTTAESSPESGPSEGEGGARKRGRHKGTKKASARPPGSSSGQGEQDSGKASSSSSPSNSSEDSGTEKQKQRKKKKRRKRHSSVSERGRERVQEKRSKRKNWKVAADENSEDSSDED
nr:PREDICTED: uncharacterized protein C11orf57 homolog [Anolis carolinensis]|eukprot:XP_003229583.2 PREDICTED: uncharacterized protein C11orf57 homolog [Anolis carolinensis]